MKARYVPPIKGTRRRQTPEKWKTGPDPLTREKYYAYLKHRAQANYRNEDYSLSWEDWHAMWDDASFLQRGRSSHSLCIAMKDRELGWHAYNVEIVNRSEALSRAVKDRYARS